MNIIEVLAIAIKNQIVAAGMSAENRQHPEDQPYSAGDFFNLADEIQSALNGNNEKKELLKCDVCESTFPRDIAIWCNEKWHCSRECLSVTKKELKDG